MDPSELPLRDIHLPGDLSWWPPAIGWWLLALVLIISLWRVFSYLKKNQQLPPFRHFDEQLATIEQTYAANQDSHQLVRGLSRFVRQAALQLAPRDDVASLTGEKWLSVLDSLAGSGTGVTLQTETGRTLLRAPYDPHALSNGPELLRVVKTWFGHIKVGL